MENVVNVECFSSRAQLAEALACSLASEGKRTLAAGSRALFALSGGRTPALFLRALRAQPLAWNRIAITLVDERWVSEQNPRSNASLVRKHLLAHRKEAQFFPLYNGASTPQAGRAVLEQRFAPLFAQGVCALVLGMGEDGHTASLFPHAAELAQALDLRRHALLCATSAPEHDEPRLSLTLRAILQARALYLHIEGEGKQRTLAHALQCTSRRCWRAMPIRSVLAHRGKDLRVFYCPEEGNKGSGSV